MVISLFKKSISIFLIIICIISSVGLFACSNSNESDEDKPFYDYSFYVSQNSLVLEKGETFQLLATYGKETVNYKSSDETVAEVGQDGLITAKNIGNAQITISAGGKERVCDVVVITCEYTVVLNKTGTVYAYNDKLTVLELIAYAKKDGEHYVDTYSWSCDSEKCTLSPSGDTLILNFNGTGEVNVTVTTGKGASASVKIIVIDSESDLTKA